MLYLSYFPKLVMGPIERADHLLPQLCQTHEFDYDEAVAGLRIFLIGLFKKVAVADSLAVIVNNVYGQCQAYQGLPLVLAALMYSLQIYGDFSGYTDMAIGISRILGIHLAENFRRPYLSASVTEYWRRWHISLSTWFRDYVYIPLGGNRVRLPRYLLNTLITMTLSGLWHGADLTFVFWGFLNGVFLCAEKLFRLAAKPAKETHGFRRIWKTALTFVLITITWVFFRADNFADALHVLTDSFTGWSFSVAYLRSCLSSMGFTWFHLVLLFIAIAVLIAIDFLQERHPLEQAMQALRTIPRWIIYLSLAVFILVCRIYNAESQQFIYFQF